MDLATLRVLIQVAAEGTEETLSKVKKSINSIEKAIDKSKLTIDLAVNSKGLDTAEKSIEKIKKSKEKLSEKVEINVDDKQLDEVQQKLKRLETEPRIKITELGVDVTDQAYEDYKNALLGITKEAEDVVQNVEINVDVNETKVITLSNTLEYAKKVVDELNKSISLFSDNEIVTEEQLGDVIKAKTVIENLIEDLEAPNNLEIDINQAYSNIRELESELDELKRLINTTNHASDLGIQIDTSGIEKAKAEIEKLDLSVKGAENSAENLNKSFNSLGIVAAGVFGTTIFNAKNWLDTASETTTAFLGLETAAKRIGASVSDSEKALKELNNDGLLPVQSSATTLRNLFNSGIGLDKSVQLIERFKDTAAAAKKSGSELSQAIVSASEAIKTGNSTLLKSIGITVDFGKAYEDYARTVNKAVSELSEAEKVEARIAIVMQETNGYIGTAAILAESYAGAQAEAAASSQKLASALGDSLEPSATKLTKAYASATNSLANFVGEHPNLISYLAKTVIGVSGLTTALVAYQKTVKVATQATEGFKLAVSKVGAAGGFAFLVFSAIELVNYLVQLEEASEQFSEKMLKLEEIDPFTSQSEQVLVLEENIRKATVALEELTEGQRRYEEFLASDPSDYYEKVIDIFEDINKALLALDIDFVVTRYEDFAPAIELVNRVLLDEEKILSETNKALQENADLQKTEINLLEQTQTSIKTYTTDLRQLNSTYATLAKGEDLSINNLLDLIQLYPSVAAEIAENGYEREKLIDIVDAERDAKKAALLEELEQQKVLVAEQKRRLQLYLDSLKTETSAHGTAYASQEEDLVNYGNKVLEVIENIKNRAITEVSTQETWKDSVEAIETLVQEEIDRLTEEEKALNDTIDAINNINIKDYQLASGGSKSSAKNETDEFKEIWDEYQHYIKIEQFENLEDQKSWLNSRLENVKKSTSQERQLIEENFKLDKEIRESAMSAALDTLDTYYDAWQKIGKKAYSVEDIETYIAALGRLETMYSDLADEYSEYAEEQLKVAEALEQAQEDLTNKITENARKQVDELVRQEERASAILKSYAGLKYENKDTGEIETFEYTEAMEIQSYLRRIGENQKFIDELMSRREELTEYEEQQLESALEQVRGYYEKIEDLQIQSLHTQQKALETAYKEQIDALKSAFKAEESAYKDATAAIKAEYAERIQAAKDSSKEEVQILQNKIKEINALIYQQEIQDQDALYEDKVRRLQSLLDFEVDDTNRYELQKEIDKLRSEYEKRKQKEALEAQKDSLQAEIDAIQNAADERVSALENERDAEIAALESTVEAKQKQYEIDTENLERELEKQQAEIFKNYEEIIGLTEENILDKLEQYEKDTANLQGELDNQYDNSKRLTEKTYQKYKEHSKDVKNLVEDTGNDIIRWLINLIPDFADAGKRAGQAYADAFQRAASSALGYASSRSASVSYSIASAMESQLAAVGAEVVALTTGRTTAERTAFSNAQAASAYPQQQGEIKYEQTINFHTPVKSPYKQAKEIQELSRNLIRGF